MAAFPLPQDEAQPPLLRPVGETCESHWWGTDRGQRDQSGRTELEDPLPRRRRPVAGQELPPGPSVPTRPPAHLLQLYTCLSSGPPFCSAGRARAVELLFLQSRSGELQLMLGYQGVERNNVMTISYPHPLYPSSSVQFSRQVIILCFLEPLSYSSAEPSFYR